MEHSAQSWLHAILFALWLGSHVAIMVLMWQIRVAAGAEAEQRRLASAMMAVERVPRTAFVLMLPMGLQLAENLGLFELDGMGAAGAWLIALVWLAGIWIQPRNRRTDAAVGLRMAQRVLMVSVAILMLGTAVLSLISGAPIALPWLAGKFALYGLALLIVFGIEAVTQDVVYAAGDDGRRKAPPIDRAIEHALPRAATLSLLLYACLAAASYLGLVKPVF